MPRSLARCFIHVIFCGQCGYTATSQPWQENSVEISMSNVQAGRFDTASSVPHVVVPRLMLRGGKRGSSTKKSNKSGWHHFASDDILFRYEDSSDERENKRTSLPKHQGWTPPPLNRNGNDALFRAGPRAPHPAWPRARVAGRNNVNPVYWQVCEQLNKLNVSSVLDLGCGGGALLTWINILCKDITWYAGTDLHRPALQELVRRFSAETPPKAVLSPRGKDLHVVALHGNVAAADERVGSMEAVTLLNVLEHMRPADVSALEEALFGAQRPPLVLVVVAECADGGMEADDLRHDVEWSEGRLDSWRAAVCAAHPAYSSRRLEVQVQAREPGAEERGKGAGGSGGGEGGRQLAALFTLAGGGGETEEEEKRREEGWRKLREAKAGGEYGGPLHGEEGGGLEVVGMLTLREFMVVGRRGLAAMDWGPP